MGWREVEMEIEKELLWLKNNITPYQKDDNILGVSDDIFYRAIAILIVSGRVQATEYDFDVSAFIGVVDENNEIKKMHGSYWHDSVIKSVSRYLIERDLIVNNDQPSLAYGYADVSLDISGSMFYLEVDTINIFKLWVNLVSMKGVSIINLRPHKIIKFKVV